ncbi:hypothetical protein FS842_001642 [Serendipita sp. 407]|nr:hypothetical protein FS842_001642 [Serendipita sp. 407]
MVLQISLQFKNGLAARMSSPEIPYGAPIESQVSFTPAVWVVEQVGTGTVVIDVDVGNVVTVIPGMQTGVYSPDKVEQVTPLLSRMNLQISLQFKNGFAARIASPEIPYGAPIESQVSFTPAVWVT